MRRGLLLLLAALCLAAPAFAHEGSRSQSVWRLEEDRLLGLFRMEARQATLLLNTAPPGTQLGAALQRALAEGLTINRGGQACSLNAAPLVSADQTGRLQAEMDWRCARSDGALEITVNVITPLSADHVHFIRLVTGEGGAEDVLTRQRLTLTLDPDEARGFGAAMGRYFALGVEHILLGPDHLVFLAALLLLVRRLRDVLTLTIGFTLGHSITLALAATGRIAPPDIGVESLIGFSILFTAAEAASLLKGLNGYRLAALLGGAGAASWVLGGVLPWTVWAALSVFAAGYAGWREAGGRQEAAAPALSAGFGLLHGVGFAGILLETGLAPGQAAASLLGFNLGVEVGQLLAVGAALLAYAGLTRLFPQRAGDALRLAGLALTAFLGAFWFFGRLLG